MRRSTGLALLLAGGVVAASGVTIPAQAEVREAPARTAAGDLKTDLDQILADGRLTGATAGVTVRDAGTGAVLYTHNADQRVVPASNNKLETTAAAFGILGTGYRFRTDVSTRGGRLYLRGTGDPTLDAAAYDRLAADVAAKGVKTVKGDLVADDSWFEGPRLGPDWDPTDFPYYYAAEISALTVTSNADLDVGTVLVDVVPGEPGQQPKVSVTPGTGVVTIDNRATTGAVGSASTVSVDRTVGTNTIVVSGSIPAGVKFEDEATVQDPALYAADVFRRALKAHGVTVKGDITHGTTPRGARVVTARRSIPLSQIAVPYLKLSNNMIAEILVKEIGKKVTGHGSWTAGLPVVAKYLKTLGVDTSQVKQTDGSGLGHSNYTTATQISNVLKAVQRKSYFPVFYDALPIAGQPDRFVGGTLRSRMGGTPAAGNVHAKTGTLTGVSALSGYVKDPAGRRLIFSIVFNGYKGGAPTDLQDKIAVRLAGGSTASVRSTARSSGGVLECSWSGSC
ncbi:D-alanyl-D-alanine carboxypeptidase/D-alanyl-D-alanine-endopeptidase [Actinomadura sp. DC4]|uniref:D-alanyl-D-alanine carboxypeptidase/D-alanyl-D-alanine endopeptidase n=1 Tax=Actinomadura sp. DC4 TaxID=3055069 RepID=UPI0025B1E7C4|nr:D-alanyl-D-alanine carboxypeptidase/D-alanyl-D-alanine-endopeptidase [Actinomadura sp. DC4]MDN3356019.1 D-alanyl-D-alanine carboxypeptidase/D-alanyl-D-alanine-endopeptidase [Actinomadura sp. DC4]